MADLDLAICLRNARLDAYREQGVPVDGGWAYRAALHQVWLTIRCLVCGSGRERVVSLGEWDLAGEFNLAAYVERDLLQGMAVECTHLIRLAAPDPPEIELYLFAVEHLS